jgi:hypothetical protein
VASDAPAVPVVPERDDALRRGDAAWLALSAALDARIDTTLGYEDGSPWTGKDVYAHLARWQQDSIDKARALLAKQLLPTSHEHENVINARWYAEDRALTAGEARRRCTDTRDELRAIISGLDARQWNWGKLFDDITGSHYQHHLDAIIGGTAKA